MIEDPVSIGSPNHVPVDRQLSHVRHRREHVKGRAALGCERWVADRRMMKIEREIVGEYGIVVNVAEQPLVAWPEQDRMMRDVGENASDPEMHHEQGRRERLALE